MKSTFPVRTEFVDIGGYSVHVSDAERSDTVACVKFEIEHESWFDFDQSIKEAQFIDLGASIGMVSIYVAKRHPDWHIVAVEPNPHIYRLLALNLIRNNITNVTPVCLAVGPHGMNESDYRMVMDLSHTTGNTHWDKDAEGSIASFAACRSLGQIHKAHCGEGYSPIFLKMDIEGEEHAVLREPGVFPWQDVAWFHLDTHMNDKLREIQGWSHESTIEIAKARISPECKMSVYSIEKVN